MIPRKYIPTIPKEEEKALKHSSVNCEQSAQNFRRSLSLSLEVPVYAQNEWNGWFYTDWQAVARYWFEGRRRVLINSYRCHLQVIWSALCWALTAWSFSHQNDKKWVCVSQEESVACHLPAKNSLGRKNRQQANIPN